MQGSQLKTYSIGIAAENKALNTRILNVTPIEQLPALDGEINFNPQEVLSVGQDSDGNRYEVKVTMDITLSAEWLPMGSNRLTPPDIRRGEYVEILQLGDSDRFFWRPLGIREDLRRLETVIYTFNANPDETTGNGVDFTNCYFFEVSTHTKMITLGTSKKNGEPFQYTFQLNAAEGRVTLADDIGNFIEMDSRERSIRAQNTDESFVLIDKRRILAQNTDKSFVDIDQTKIRLEDTAGDFVQLKDGKIEVEANSELTLKVGSSEFKLESSITTLTTPRFEGGRG